MLRSSRDRKTATATVVSAEGRKNPAAKRIRQLMDASKWKQAWAEVKPLLAQDPRNPSIQWVAGLLQRELGNKEQALTYLRFAAQHIQDEADLHQQLAELERTLGHVAEAKRAFETALSLRQNVPGLLGLSKVLEASGQHAREIEVLEEAFELEPNNAQIAFRLACLHQTCFDPSPALQWAMRAVKLKEDFWEAYMILATVLQRLERLQEAVNVYHSLLLVWPNDAKINRNLGVLCLRLGMNTDAIRYFKRAAEVEPERVDHAVDIVHQLLYVSDWHGLDAQVNDMLARLRSTKETVAPFGLLSVPGATALDLKDAAERSAKGVLATVNGDYSHFARHIQPTEAERRLRVGYLSCDLHEHATGYLMARLFELHDREQVQLYAYSWDKYEEGPFRKRLKGSFEVFRDIRGLGDQQAAELIRSDEVDVLVDLKGYTRDGRLPILAYRPAPVQVHHVGFPGSTGASFVDYLVADTFVAPPEHPEYFTEKIAYLPDCYQPTDDTRAIGPKPSRAVCNLPEEAVVFCSFNQAYKIIPQVFDRWCHLLRETPGSVLWLLAWGKTSQENLCKWASERGVAPERIIFAPPLKQAEHLGRLQNADIVLDTLPVNAHTTASDALWAGVPLVTLPGEAFVSRVAGSILQTAGLSELIARDGEDYVRIALELARSPSYLAQIKQRVWEQGRSSALFNSARYTKNLDQLYRAMWRRHAQGLAPEAIHLT